MAHGWVDTIWFHGRHESQCLQCTHCFFQQNQKQPQFLLSQYDGRHISAFRVSVQSPVLVSNNFTDKLSIAREKKSNHYYQFLISPVLKLKDNWVAWWSIQVQNFKLIPLPLPHPCARHCLSFSDLAMLTFDSLIIANYHNLHHFNHFWIIHLLQQFAKL